jgi:hypothetical protein
MPSTQIKRLYVQPINPEKNVRRKREDDGGKGEISRREEEGEGHEGDEGGGEENEQKQEKEFVPAKKRKVVWAKHIKFLYDGNEIENKPSRHGKGEEDDGEKRVSGWEGKEDGQGQVIKIRGKNFDGQRCIMTYRKVDGLVRFGRRNDTSGLYHFPGVTKATEGARGDVVVGGKLEKDLGALEKHAGNNKEEIEAKETHFRLRELPAEIRRMIFMFALVDEDKVKKFTRTKTVRGKKRKRKKNRGNETTERKVGGDSELPLLKVLKVAGWMDVWREARDVYYAENRWMISVSQTTCDDEGDGEQGDKNVLELMRKVVLVVP